MAAAAALALAGCGDGEPSDASTTAKSGAPTATGGSTPAEDPEAAAVAEVEAAYQRYWDVVVAAENSGEDSYEHLKTVANELIVQEQVAEIRSMREDHITRDGAPQIGTPQVTVDGETARVESCVDEHTWNVYYKGELADQESDPQARVFDFKRDDDRWIVVDLVAKAEATITC
ncbi:hypothetical protein CLV30_12066 [Haloactinopolyspora alba]|uniref:Mce-associated membrane protein n=2 Tax=Haloactinopolyspora alba TaxID=648780 RepID=A0A2P8DM35_9ACTN|nr:hypothetical protein CLV30_12066 [Haloactinopolyspora alba]